MYGMEMRFLRAVKGCTKNGDIRVELQIYGLQDKLKEHSRIWVEHMMRMD